MFCGHECLCMFCACFVFISMLAYVSCMSLCVYASKTPSLMLFVVSLLNQLGAGFSRRVGWIRL